MGQDDLAKELARDAVSKVAPEELDAFEELATERVGGREDKDLAMGVETVVAFVTPIAIAAAKAAITHILGIVRDEGTAALRERVKAWFKSRGKPETDRVRKVAFDKARDMGLDDAQARTLADAIVGGLAG